MFVHFWAVLYVVPRAAIFVRCWTRYIVLEFIGVPEALEVPEVLKVLKVLDIIIIQNVSKFGDLSVI